MAGQVYVKLDGIDGGSQDDNNDHKNSFFDVEYFDFGGSVNYDQEAHAVTGRVNYGMSTFTMKHDRMLATLFTKMNDRKPLKEAIVHWIGTGKDGEDAKLLNLTLKDVYVISIQNSLQDEGGDSLDSNITVTISYKNYDMSTQDSRGPAVTANFDVLARKTA